MKREVRGVEEAVKILREIAYTPMMTEMHFKFVAKVDEPPQVEYYIKRFAWGGERKDEVENEN